LRFQRAKEKGIIKTIEELKKQENNIADDKIDFLLTQTDLTIENNGTLEEFYEKIDEIIQNLLNKYLEI